MGEGATGGGRAPWWGGRVSDHREGWYNWNMHPGPGTLSPSQGPQYPLPYGVKYSSIFKEMDSTGRWGGSRGPGRGLWGVTGVKG